ncbi:uncharacterized protein LOC114942815 [Nylanderia fulva]|uniref:uncharacterized protein LOC114942815 n=1 Tax=Nylanderia fulva TaxID=613905 RepID=UPI0010FB1708|nr:uncharacterized protein LOC114942815 [Nylanderia fulva]
MIVTRDDGVVGSCVETEARAFEQPRVQVQQAAPIAIQAVRLEQPPGYFLTAPEINRVGMQMPEFTPSDPVLWFNIVDRSFQAAGITVDATKFGYALTSIGPNYTAEVRDIIMNPPAEHAYETLKTELVKRLSLSQEHKTRRLLEHEEIPHLVTRTTDTIEQLTDIADAIVEATRAPAFQVAEAAKFVLPQTQCASDPGALEARLEVRLAQMRLAMQQEMAEQLTAIRKSIEAIGDGRYREDDRRRSRSRSRSRSRPRARSSSHGLPASGVCWYHWQFGAEARQCRASCSMQQQGNAGAGR